MRSGSEPSLTIDWFTADKPRSVRTCEARPCGHDASNEVLLLRHHSLESEVPSCGLPIQFVTGHMTFFDSHNAKCFRTIKANAVTFAGTHDRANRSIAIGGIYREFVGEL